MIAAFVATLGALAFVWMVKWIVDQWEQRWLKNLGPRVTRQWLHENRYDREGDEP